MPRSTVSSALLGVTVEVEMGGKLSDLGAHIKELDKKMASAVKKRIRTGISDAGDVILREVQTEAATWSVRIPTATRLSVSFGARNAGATIVTNRNIAPHARPLEMGNRGASGVLRHPVFAKPTETRDEWHWVNQPTHPFFFRGVETATPTVTARMNKVLDDVANDLGFTGP